MATSIRCLAQNSHACMFPMSHIPETSLLLAPWLRLDGQGFCSPYGQSSWRPGWTPMGRNLAHPPRMVGVADREGWGNILPPTGPIAVGLLSSLAVYWFVLRIPRVRKQVADIRHCPRSGSLPSPFGLPLVPDIRLPAVRGWNHDPGCCLASHCHRLLASAQFIIPYNLTWGYLHSFYIPFLGH